MSAEGFLRELVEMDEAQRARDARPAVIVKTQFSATDAELEALLSEYADTHRIVSLQLPEPGYAGKVRVVWERR